MKKSDLKQLIREEIQNILKEYDYRNPGYPSSSDFNKIVRQTKSRYSKMFEIDIHERSVNILTDTGHEIEIVDRPETKTINGSNPQVMMGSGLPRHQEILAAIRASLYLQMFH